MHIIQTHRRHVSMLRQHCIVASTLLKRCLNGPATGKGHLRTYANSEDPDRRAHPHSLVVIFAVPLHNIEKEEGRWDVSGRG